MNVLVYTNVISWEMHVATTIEIIQKHLDKKDKVYLFANENEELICLPHKKTNCHHCSKQANYVVEKLFENKIVKLKVKSKRKYNFPKFLNTDEILEYRYEDMPIGELAMSQITDEYRQVFHNIDILNMKISPILNQGINLYLDICELIENNKIDIVYAWNGRRATEGPTLYAGLKKKIKIYSYITGGNLNSYIIQPTTTTHDLEYSKKRIEKFYEKFYNVNDRSKKDYFISEANLFYEYMRFGGGRVWGYVYYKDLFDDTVPIEKKSQKKILSIFTSSYYEFYALGESFRKKNNKDINHYDSIKKILSSKLIFDNYDIRIRWHPNLSTAGKKELDEVKGIIEKSKKEITHYSPFNKINSYKLLEISDVVLSFGSTVGIEATYYKKPSILWGAAYYEDTGGVYEVGSLEQLETLLNKNLIAKSKISAMKFAFHERNKGEYQYNYIKYDKNFRYYYKNMRVYNPTSIELLKENLKILLKPLGLINYTRKTYYFFCKLLGVKRNESYTPSEW